MAIKSRSRRINSIQQHDQQNIRYAEIQFFKCMERDVRISSMYLYASISKNCERTHRVSRPELASGTCYTCTHREKTNDRIAKSFRGKKKNGINALTTSIRERISKHDYNVAFFDSTETCTNMDREYVLRMCVHCIMVQHIQYTQCNTDMVQLVRTKDMRFLFLIYFFLVFLVTLLSRSNGKPIHKHTNTHAHTLNEYHVLGLFCFSQLANVGTLYFKHSIRTVGHAQLIELFVFIVQSTGKQKLRPKTTPIYFHSLFSNHFSNGVCVVYTYTHARVVRQLSLQYTRTGISAMTLVDRSTRTELARDGL